MQLIQAHFRRNVRLRKITSIQCACNVTTDEVGTLEYELYIKITTNIAVVRRKSVGESEISVFDTFVYVPSLYKNNYNE